MKIERNLTYLNISFGSLESKTRGKIVKNCEDSIDVDIDYYEGVFSLLLLNIFQNTKNIEQNWSAFSNKNETHHSLK